jgi:hypothetical protein
VTGFRLSLVIAVGVVGLNAPAGAAAAGNNSLWRYAVTSASGSASWRYSGLNGGGDDLVIFHGSARQATAQAASVSGMLHGMTSYTDQNSSGCGPVTHTQSRYYRSLSFSVPSTETQPPYVVVTWNFPLPNQSYCHEGTLSDIGQQLRGRLSEKVPLARFTCDTMSFKLSGAARLSEGWTTGTLTYEATVTLTRPPTPIVLSF